MLACRIHGAEDLRVESMPEPKPGPGEVCLKLGAGGICGSDLHYFLHGRIGSFLIREPALPVLHPPGEDPFDLRARAKMPALIRSLFHHPSVRYAA